MSFSPPESSPLPGAYPPAGCTRAAGFDLLRLRGVRRVVASRFFPYVLQALLLMAFVAIAALAWDRWPPAGVNGKLFAKANLATLIVWGLWWPAMIWGAVLFGRAWCAVCPLELVSNGAERAAHAVGLPLRRLGRGLTGGVVVVGLYAAVQLCVAGAKIHRVPAYTAWFLISLLALALVTSLVFRDRAFCRGFCPVGLLLGVYGRGGLLAVRAASKAACTACRDRACLVAGNRSALDARSCPSLLNPARLDCSDACLLCAQCLKSCGPHNLRLLVRRPFAASDRRAPLASWPVTLFVMLVSGFVTAELFSEWPAAQKYFLAAPEWVAHRTGLPNTWMEGAWFLTAFPLALWLVLAALMRWAGARRTLGEIWRGLALPVAVIVSMGHMGKALAKFVSWLPFLPGAVVDPQGIATVHSLTAITARAPAPLLSLATVSWLGLALLFAGVVLAVREYRLAQPPGSPVSPAIWPLGALALGFAAIVAGWH